MLDQQDLRRSEYDRQLFSSLPKPNWLDAAARPEVLDSDPDYIAPSLFSYTLQVDQPIHKLLRSRDLADVIMEQYWRSVHPVACIVHRPSFQEKYNHFWYNTSRRVKDIPESTHALVYAALFAGVVSMDAESVRQELGGEREDWVKALEKATAISLSRAHVIRTEKPETMQAFVMYLVRNTSLCRLSVETCNNSGPRRSKALIIVTDSNVSKHNLAHPRNTRLGGHRSRTRHGTQQGRYSLRVRRGSDPSPPYDMAPALLPGYPCVRSTKPEGENPQR